MQTEKPRPDVQAGVAAATKPGEGNGGGNGEGNGESGRGGGVRATLSRLKKNDDVADALKRERPPIHTYTYALTTGYGVRVKGKIRATTEDQARALIGQPRAEITSLKKQNDFWAIEIGRPKVKREELILFTRQLAAFTRSGIPIVTALGTIGGRSASKTMQDTLRHVAWDVTEGMNLSEALARHASVFPQFLIDLIRAGEATGNIDEMFDRAADYIERQEEASKKVRSALAYPSVIAAMAVVTVVAMVTFVLPRFVSFFDSLDAELPLPTKVLIEGSSWFSTYWVFVLGLILVLTLALTIALMTEPGQYVKDVILVRAPVLGTVIRYAIIERFCHTLSTLVHAGVPLIETFAVIIDGARNRVFQRALVKVQESMMVGDGMSGPIAATGLFPESVVQIVKVGEETGTLDDQLEIAADLFATELDFRLKRFTALFEPIVIVVMGGFVGFVALALVSAMYGIFNQVGTP